MSLGVGGYCVVCPKNVGVGWYCVSQNVGVVGNVCPKNVGGYCVPKMLFFSQS